MKKMFFLLLQESITLPIILHRDYKNHELEDLKLHGSIEIGSLLIDGFLDGMILSHPKIIHNSKALRDIIDISFCILQACRIRVTKTEYISCPSCGRTLFDLEETTRVIREHTHHLKGIKIGIMGCIVNGPGEMADADYGYVGSGKGKITLYRKQEVVKRNIESKYALQELIELIKEDGKWIDLRDNTYAFQS